MQRCLVPLLAMLGILCGGSSMQAMAGGTTGVNPSLSTVAVLTQDNRLLRVNGGMPLSVLDDTAITGLQAGEIVMSIDARPATGQLYGLGTSGMLYTLDVNTGVATPKAFLTADPADLKLESRDTKAKPGKDV